MADYSTLLPNHVTLTDRSIDRICLQAYVPKLQAMGWCVSTCAGSSTGTAILSLAAFGQIGDAYTAEVHRFAAAHGIPVRYFVKGVKRRWSRWHSWGAPCSR